MLVQDLIKQTVCKKILPIVNQIEELLNYDKTTIDNFSKRYESIKVGTIFNNKNNELIFVGKGMTLKSVKDEARKMAKVSENEIRKDILEFIVMKKNEQTKHKHSGSPIDRVSIGLSSIMSVDICRNKQTNN